MTTVGRESSETGDCTRLEDKLGIWLRSAHRAFGDHVNVAFSGYRLNQLDFFIMTYIRQAPGCRQSAISRALGIKSPNVASAIEYLVQRRFVQKVIDPIDKRANRLVITIDGNALLCEMSAIYENITSMCLPDAASHEAMRALQSITQRLTLNGRPLPPDGSASRSAAMRASLSRDGENEPAATPMSLPEIE